MAIQLVHYFLFAIFPAALAYAALSDLLTLTIPNRLIAVIAITFVALSPIIGMGWQDFGLHFAAGGIVLVLGFTCFALGWIGGGDAKLAAVIALFLGSEHALTFVGLASVLGGGLTLLLLGFREAVVPAFIIRQSWLHRLHDRSTGVPYGIALAAAAVPIYWQSAWMQIVTG